MTKRYVDPHWYYLESTQELIYWPGGEVETGMALSAGSEIRVPHQGGAE